METPSDSDRSHRARIKTPFEILFDEEPVFSDSEDEATFFRINFGSPADQSKFTSLLENNFDPSGSDELTDQILKVCCNECICCHRIRSEIIDSQLKRQRESDSSQVKERKAKKSKKINLISNQLIKKPSSVNKKRNRNDLKKAQKQNLTKNVSPSETASFNELLEQLNEENNKPKKSPKIKSNSHPAIVLDSATNMEIQEKIVSKSAKPSRKGNIVRLKLDFNSEENRENNKNVVNSPSTPSESPPKAIKSQKCFEDKLVTSQRSSRGSKSKKIHTSVPRRKSTSLKKKQAFETLNMTKDSNLSVANDVGSPTKRIKLYSPESWLNSKIFEEICMQ